MSLCESSWYITCDSILCSRASKRHVRKRASTLIGGELVSSLLLWIRCFHPSGHPQPMSFPQDFCFRNMRYFNAACFHSWESCFAWHPSITFQYTSCSSSVMIASARLRLALRVLFVATISVFYCSRSMCHSHIYY